MDNKIEQRLKHSLDYGKACLREEAQAILDIVPEMDGSFEQAVRMMYGCHGKIIVTGRQDSCHAGLNRHPRLLHQPTRRLSRRPGRDDIR